MTGEGFTGISPPARSPDSGDRARGRMEWPIRNRFLKRTGNGPRCESVGSVELFDAGRHTNFQIRDNTFGLAHMRIDAVQKLEGATESALGQNVHGLAQGLVVKCHGLAGHTD